MSRVKKFRYRFTNGENWIMKVFNLGEICNGEPVDFLSDNALLKKYKYVGEDEYTGLLDKNKVEIYEGDIVKTSYGKIGDVAYHIDRAMFIIHDQNHFNEPLFDDAFNSEVVGNIYEHPHLLNKEQAVKVSDTTGA